MRATTIKFSKQVTSDSKPSLGKYENESFSVEAVVMEGESVETATAALVGLVLSTLGVSIEGSAVETVTKPKQESLPPKLPPKPKKKAAPKKVEEVVAETKEEAPVEEKKAAPKKAKTPPKGTVYDRENQAHKQQFAKTLSDICPQWRSSGKGKEISEALVGVQMFNTKGDVLEAFTTKLAELVQELIGDEAL